VNDLTSRERLQPSLLDRLTDDEPGDVQESADKRVLSPNQLKVSVLRDLTWLLRLEHSHQHQAVIASLRLLIAGRRRVEWNFLQGA
jgi:predicted component of type VI protein secretion system